MTSWLWEARRGVPKGDDALLRVRIANAALREILKNQPPKKCEKKGADQIKSKERNHELQ